MGYIEKEDKDSGKSRPLELRFETTKITQHTCTTRCSLLSVLLQGSTNRHVLLWREDVCAQSSPTCLPTVSAVAYDLCDKAIHEEGGAR